MGAEMIKLVAKAIAHSYALDPDAALPNPPQHMQGWKNWQTFTVQARSAIRAMREPNRAMIEAGIVKVWDGEIRGDAVLTVALTWRDMIDTALED